MDDLELENFNLHEFNRRIREQDSVANLVGGTTTTQAVTYQLEMEQKGRDTPFASLTEESDIGIATGLMYPIKFGKKVARNIPLEVEGWNLNPFYLPPDPNFVLGDKVTEIQSKYPERLWGNFSGVQSEEEYRAISDEIDEELEDTEYLASLGNTGIAAQFIAGTVDPLVFTPLKWSYTGHMMQKGMGQVLMPMSAVRARGMAYGIGAGAESAVASTILQETMMEDGDLGQSLLPSLTLGLALGSLGGAVGAFDPVVRESAMKAAEGYRAGNARNLDAEIGPQDHNIPGGSWFKSTTKGDLKSSTVLSNVDSSAGATSAPANVLDLSNSKLTSDELEAVSKARQYILDNEINDADVFEVRGHPVGNWLYKNVNKVPWLADAHAIHFNSGSAIHRMMAHTLFSGGSNVAPNIRNADLMASRMEGNIAAPAIKGIENSYLKWIDDTKTPRGDAAYREFLRQVKMYSHERYWGRDMPNVHPAVKEASLAGDQTAKTALDWMQDVAGGGTTAVRGAEVLDAAEGWMPLRWSWKQMQKALATASEKLGRNISEDDLVKALVKGYQKAHPDLPKKTLAIWAKAVLRRSRALDQGLDTNLMRQLQQNGEQYVKEMLMDSGVAEARALKLIEEIRGIQGEKNIGKVLRHRNEIDLNIPIGDTGLTLMDLTEQDIGKTWLQYSRHAAHLGANARWGFQVGDVEKLWEMGNRELEAKGLPRLSDAQRDYMVRASMGNAVNDVNPWARRAAMLSNLSLLNSQGLTQVADTGAAIAQFGVSEYMKWGGKVLSDARAGKQPEAMKQLADLNYQIRGENAILQPERALDDFRMTPEYNQGLTEFIGGFMDKALTKGTKLQAVVSMYETVHLAQHSMVAKNFLQQFSKIAAGTEGLSKARLEDMGFYGKSGDALFERLTKYFKDGTVKFGEDGEVLDLAPEKWDMQDWQDFGNIQYHMANQLTMKILRGERSAWQTETLGYLFANLRTFNLTALQKITVRNLRIMDAKTTATALFTLTSAALVVMARDAISGRDEKMSAEDITRAALSLGSFTGGPSIGVDTLGAILGIDALRISPYRHEGPAGTQVLPEIIGLTQLEKMAHVPSAVGSLLFGNADKQDITALQSLPIIGNLYGFTYIFNRMKSHISEERRAEKQREREAKQSQEEVAPEESLEEKYPSISSENLQALQEAGFLTE